MATKSSVRFELFGGLRAVREGKEVLLPESSAGTYLRLLLLSGQPFLNNGPGRRMGSSESIRAIVDRSNRPKRVAQWGHYDFTSETGLEFRYREPAGICLIGDGWTSDIQDFEEIHDKLMRSLPVSDEELQRALDLSERSLDIDRWPKEPVLNDCWEWAKERVNELYEHRVQIFEELESRQQQMRASAKEQGSSYMSEPNAKELKEEETIPETSGLEQHRIEPGSIGESSTPVREVMRDPPGVRQPAEPVTTKQTSAWHSDVPVLNWIRDNSVAEQDSTKLTELRSTYACSDDEMLKILDYAYAYGTEMIDCDPGRAGGLFVDSALGRLTRGFKRRFLGGWRDRANTPDLGLLSFIDAMGEDWPKTIAREQCRREELSDETGESTSFEAKRFYRAVLIRTFKQIQYRGKQLKDNISRSSKGISLMYAPTYDGELKMMFDVLLGLTHLEGFRLIEIHREEKRHGGIDPKSLNLRPNESEATRARRAERMPWVQIVLADAYAVPDWSRPVARDLSDHQRTLIVTWAGYEAEHRESQRLKQIAIETERPVPLRGKKKR
jgi:hypothetical protein